MPEYNVKKEDPATTALKMDHISEWRSKLEMMPDDVLKRIIAGVGPEDIPQGLEIFAMGVAADRTKLRGAQSEPAPTSSVKDQVVAELERGQGQGQGLNQLANVEIPPGGITEAVPAAPAEEAPAAPTAMAEGGRISPQYKESKKKTSKAMMAAYHNKYAEPGERQFDYPTKANLVVAKEGGIVGLANGGLTSQDANQLKLNGDESGTDEIDAATKAAAATDAPQEEGEGTIYKAGRDVVNWAKENPGALVGLGLMFLPGVGLVARGVGLMSKLVGKFGSRAFTAVKNPSIKARRLLGDQTKAQYPKKQGLFNKKVPYKTKDYNSKADAESALKASKFDRKQEIVKSGTWRDKKGKMRSTWAIVPTRTSMMTSGKTAGLVGLGGLTAAGLSNYEGVANPAAVNAGTDNINKGEPPVDAEGDPGAGAENILKKAKNEGMSKDTALGLMAMGAKMMQTKRPDALGAAGEGLGALVDQSVIQRGLATDATTAGARVRANEIAARQNKLTAMTAVQKSLWTARAKARDSYDDTIMALLDGIPDKKDHEAAVASDPKVHALKIVMKDLDTQLENLRKQFVAYGVNIGGAPQQVAGGATSEFEGYSRA